MRTFAIHDALKRFAEGAFDASQDMTGTLNGPMSRLHDELTTAMNAEVEERFEEAKADLEAEIENLEREKQTLIEELRQPGRTGAKPCPRCGGEPLIDF